MTNDVEVKKEIEEISRERHKANLARELEENQKNIDFNQKTLDMLNADRENVKKKYQIVRDHFRIVKPTWEYEVQEEYLECLLHDLKSKEWQDMNAFDQNEEQLNKVLEHRREARESLLEEQKRLEEAE